MEAWLIMDEETGRRFSDIAYEAGNKLVEIVRGSSDVLPESEAQDLRLTVSEILNDIYQRIIKPIHDLYPSLAPEEDDDKDNMILKYLYESISTKSLSMSDEEKEEALQNLKTIMLEKGILPPE
jgi:hypothetical protein